VVLLAGECGSVKGGGSGREGSGICMGGVGGKTASYRRRDLPDGSRQAPRQARSNYTPLSFPSLAGIPHSGRLCPLLSSLVSLLSALFSSTASPRQSERLPPHAAELQSFLAEFEDGGKEKERTVLLSANPGRSRLLLTQAVCH